MKIYAVMMSEGYRDDDRVTNIESFLSLNDATKLVKKLNDNNNDDYKIFYFDRITISNEEFEKYTNHSAFELIAVKQEAEEKDREISDLMANRDWYKKALETEHEVNIELMAPAKEIAESMTASLRDEVKHLQKVLSEKNKLLKKKVYIGVIDKNNDIWVKFGETNFLNNRTEEVRSSHQMFEEGNLTRAYAYMGE